jgi:hypothetical protein
MGLASTNALALIRWHGMRDFHHTTQNDIILWVVAAIAVLGLIAWAVQRRKRRWFRP